MTVIRRKEKTFKRNCRREMLFLVMCGDTCLSMGEQNHDWVLTDIRSGSLRQFFQEMQMKLWAAWCGHIRQWSGGNYGSTYSEGGCSWLELGTAITKSSAWLRMFMFGMLFPWIFGNMWCFYRLWFEMVLYIFKPFMYLSLQEWQCYL